MSEENTLYENIEIKDLENSEIEIVGEIKAEKQADYRSRAIKNLGKDVVLPGFRKGHIPEKVLLQKIGEINLLQEIAELALQEAYPLIVEGNNLKVIGPPQVTITKLVPGNPIGFKIVSAIVPEVTLPDYKKIAEEEMKKEETTEITDGEFESMINQVKLSREKQKNPEATPEEQEKIKVGDLPDLDDSFVKTLGDFENVDDFKKKVRENMQKEKEQKAKEKKRVATSEKIIEQSKIVLPKLLIEGELDKMISQFKDDISRMGLKYEDYLSHLKKTEEDIRTEWKSEAEKRGKLQLILNKIATLEKVSVDPAEVEKETKHILTHFKDAKEDRVRIYAETMMINEKVFQFLENQKNT